MAYGLGCRVQVLGVMLWGLMVMVLGLVFTDLISRVFVRGLGVMVWGWPVRLQEKSSGAGLLHLVLGSGFGVEG